MPQSPEESLPHGPGHNEYHAPQTETDAADFLAPSTPEQYIDTEKTREKEQPQQEEEKSTVQEAIGSVRSRFAGGRKRPTKIPQLRDELTVRIEHIMEEGLKEAYLELPPLQQQEFKLKGEETAFKIRELMKSTHVRVKKIFKLLFAWLRLLPGINRFFLEQEAKIKTDKIIALKQFDDDFLGIKRK